MSNTSRQFDRFKKRDKEISALQNLRTVLCKAKRELNNDLTKLAIKNLPIIVPDSETEKNSNQTSPSKATVSLSQSTEASEHEAQQQSLPESSNIQFATSSDVQQLEPLDLDF